MPQRWPTGHRTIVVVDVAGFTDPGRTLPQQQAVHEALYEVLDRAFAESEVGLDACHREDRGDGVMILTSQEGAASLLADRLPGRLVAGLRRHNDLHSAGAAMKLRVALHAGEVGRDGHGVVSQAVNLAFRLVEAPEAKSALTSSAGVLALIASENLYHDVIAQDVAAEPGSYQRIPVPLRDNSTSAWLRLLGHPATVEREPGVAIEARDAIVEALVEVGLADDAPDRSLLIKMTGDHLAHPLRVPQRSVGKDHLIELVNACARVQGGMAALARAVWVMRPGSPESERVSRLAGEPHVLELLPSEELQRLREWLLEITIPQLLTLVHRAGGLGVPPARSLASAWEGFSHLAEFNAGADGFPPALMFVELVAHQVGGEVAAKLTGWNDEQARRLRLEPVLRARRAAVGAPVSTESRLHLMIIVQPDAIDPDRRFLLSYLRQDDPSDWPPAHSEPRLVTLGELERSVDDLVVSAERAWSGHACPVALEFVLPRALLNLPVHRWHKEHDLGDPHPLCLAYPVVVRSLERMQSPQWHRVWRLRHEMLMNDLSAALVYFGQPADAAEPHSINADLSDPRWALMVLTMAPSPQPRPGADELGAALRSGLPALVWHPEASPEALREVVFGLVESDGLADLPGRAHDLRRDAFRASGVPPDVHIARDLVVLWDDPQRVVTLDQPPEIPHPRGEIADEPERAS